ncbi:haloacid dehalogenase-like hydrolase [Fusarium phyllophilum]|uniref:Haloacid dehalogenase-like hydrolase n=1 Tax=Fusarium phyllophilum TaxID=47803 RepID=A0A8H5ILU7_9HYPO|nr:haloacid dehalogenase-like hydrolase [Fusarium phyllophilum]
MAAPDKNVVFDVVGTLVSYEHLYEAIKQRLGNKLIPVGIQPTLLGIFWLEMAEREYAYLSFHGHYVQLLKLFEALFYRCLHYAGDDDPRSFATAEEVAYLMGKFKELKLRDGAAEYGVAKACPEAYGPILKKLSTSDSKPWFAAAHLWDVSGAQSAGFRTAYSLALEGEYLYEIYGELDVVAETLPAMAEGIIAASSSRENS